MLAFSCFVGWFIRQRLLSVAAVFFANFSTAVGHVAVRGERLGLSVRWRPARQWLTFTRSVWAGLCFPALRFLVTSSAQAVASFPGLWLSFTQCLVGFRRLAAAGPNRSFNRTQNGGRRFVPSLALGAG
jgi:hypothetical protein